MVKVMTLPQPKEPPTVWERLEGIHTAKGSEYDLLPPLTFASNVWNPPDSPTRYFAWAPPFSSPAPYADQEKVLQSIAASLEKLVPRIAKLEADVADIRKHADVVIATFCPEPYTLRHSIPIHIQPTDGSFVATFFDANISTSGETEEEAFANLKSLIAETFDFLESVPEEQLGPEPFRQLAVLREFVSSAR